MHDTLPRKLLFGEVKGHHPPARPRSSLMLHYVTVNTVVLVGLTGMHKTGCSGETRLVMSQKVTKLSLFVHESNAKNAKAISSRHTCQTHMPQQTVQDPDDFQNLLHGVSS